MASKAVKQQKPSSNPAPAALNLNNFPGSMGTASAKTKPRSRGMSPFSRSSAPAVLSNDAADRATYAVRGQLMAIGINNSKPTTTATRSNTTESNPKLRRQSCSPRRMRSHQKAETTSQAATEAGSSGDRGRRQLRSTPQVQGSRMVDRVMNARKVAN